MGGLWGNRLRWLRGSQRVKVLIKVGLILRGGLSIVGVEVWIAGGIAGRIGRWVGEGGIWGGGGDAIHIRIGFIIVGLVGLGWIGRCCVVAWTGRRVRNRGKGEGGRRKGGLVCEAGTEPGPPKYRSGMLPYHYLRRYYYMPMRLEYLYGE